MARDPSGGKELDDEKFSGAENASQTFTIILKTLGGYEIPFDNISASDTVLSLKQRIEEKEGISVRQQSLLHANKYISGGVLADYGVKDKSIIRLQIPVVGGCFVNGTKILTHDLKSVNIEDLKVGDSVCSFDLVSNQIVTSSIDAIPLFQVNELVQLSFSISSEMGSKQLVNVVCTESHPFWCVNKNTYCCIGDVLGVSEHGKLCLNDKILFLSENGGTLVANLRRIERKYVDPGLDDLHLPDQYSRVHVRTLSLTGPNHNFFANGVLVHNKTLPKAPVEKNRGGKFKTIDKSSSLYNEHNTVSAGLNYGGTCQNKSCSSYKKNVVMKRGFGENIDPRMEAAKGSVVCPGCKEKFELDRFYLYACDCTMKYKYGCGMFETKEHKPRAKDYVKLSMHNRGDKKTNEEYQYLKFFVYRENCMPEK